MRYIIIGLLVATGFAANADVVDTFHNVCMKGLGKSQETERAAKAAGFKRSPISDVMGGYMGDKAGETVQINIATRNSWECAVTRSDVADPEELRSRFFNSLGLKTRKAQVSARVGGQRYVFKFDTSGGEALVVYQK